MIGSALADGENAQQEETNSPLRASHTPKKHSVTLLLCNPEHLVGNRRPVLVDAATTTDLMVIFELDFTLGIGLDDVQDTQGLGHDFRADMVARQHEDAERLGSRHFCGLRDGADVGQ